MIRCEDGHLYDPAKHAGCPWCGVGAQGGAGAQGDAGKTVAIRQDPARASAPPPPPPAASFGQAGTTPIKGGATVRLVEKEIGVDPVVGWLVAVEGPMRGRDFTLRTEKNFIGRDASMQICLSGDSAVSRAKHASVVFERKKRLFWLIPGDASGLVYRNGDVVNAPVLLAERDSIEVGASRLVLVSFVNDNFQWTAE